MLKYAVLILWRKKGVPANFYAFCISAANWNHQRKAVKKARKERRKLQTGTIKENKGEKRERQTRMREAPVGSNVQWCKNPNLPQTSFPQNSFSFSLALASEFSDFLS